MTRRRRFGDPMQVTRALYHGADQDRRWREAVDASRGLPISPDVARRLLDQCVTPRRIREMVSAVEAIGRWVRS